MTYMTYRDRVRAVPATTASWLDQSPPIATRSTFLRASPIAAVTVALETVLGVCVFAFFGVMFDSVIAGGF